MLRVILFGILVGVVLQLAGVAVPLLLPAGVFIIVAAVGLL